MSGVIEVKNLRKTYGDFKLDDLSFDLDKGYVMGFIGPNGAGKSTTIKLMMNLIHRESGSIRLFGMDNIRDEKKVKERIGFVYDESPFYGVLTVKEISKVISPFYYNWDQEKFAAYINKFGLSMGKRVGQLSKGMKAKLSLAVALSHGADLLLMDEPTSGLDPVFRSELLDILYEIMQDEEKTIFFSTHITNDLEKIADYITFINDGKLVFTDTLDSIKEHYVIVKGDKSLLDYDTRKALIGIRETNTGFEGLSNDAQNVREIFSGNVLIEKATLDEIMVYSVRGNRHV